jgi:dihydropteroate synthase
MFCLTKGANILRAHDVKEAKECITLLQELEQEKD